MFQHVVLDRSLLDLFLSLHFELVKVVGHPAVVLIGACNRWLLNLFDLGMHVIYGPLDIILYEVLLLPRRQLIQVDSFRHWTLIRSLFNLAFFSASGVLLRRRSLTVLGV